MEASPELARLLAAAEKVRATRYRRRSAYCGGSDLVADGLDVRLWQAWLSEAVALAGKVQGPGSGLAERLRARLEGDPSIEALEGAVAELRRELGTE